MYKLLASLEEIRGPIYPSKPLASLEANDGPNISFIGSRFAQGTCSTNLHFIIYFEHTNDFTVTSEALKPLN